MDMDISMDIHAKSVDVDVDMDGKFHIHGNPDPLQPTVSRILYAVSSWGGFLTTDFANILNAVFRRLRRLCYTNCTINI